LRQKKLTDKDNRLLQRNTLALAVLAAIAIATLPLFAGEPQRSLQPIKTALPDSAVIAGKVVYVDFWASWCVPCRQSFPWMKRLQERYRDQGLRIVAVTVDKEIPAARQFLKETGAEFTVIYDSTGTLAKAFDLKAMPTSFIFGRDGRYDSQHRGFVPKDTTAIEATLKNLLAQKAPK